MSRVSDIKDGQPRTMVLLNIKKRCAIYRLVQEHRVAALPRRGWKFHRRNDNQIARGSRESDTSRHPTDNSRKRHPAKILRQRLLWIRLHETLSPSLCFATTIWVCSIPVRGIAR